MGMWYKKMTEDAYLSLSVGGLQFELMCRKQDLETRKSKASSIARTSC